MCTSCGQNDRFVGGLSRRTFIGITGAGVGSLLFAAGADAEAAPELVAAPKPKTRGLVRGAFFYPPADVVNQGKDEGAWKSEEHWFTWPGNQWEPEKQQAKFLAKVGEMAGNLDLDLDLKLDAGSIYTEASVRQFIESIKDPKPEALLLFDFWGGYDRRIGPVLDAYDGPVILYHPVGANHQLPPEKFRTAKRTQYIHSIENWEALERGLRSIHTMVRMRQSTLLRVSGAGQATDQREPFFNTRLKGIPAAEFNALFDETAMSAEMKNLAQQVRSGAQRVTDLSDQAFDDAVRAHATVLKLMARHQADAITIDCLFLKHRKPCLSFGLTNGMLVPCACENDLNAALTLMLGASLFGRPGFQHNPEFDTEQNLYFGAHCTCTTRLHGPGGKSEPYALRPFFHQLPKTLAYDVLWPTGEPVTLCKYHSGEKRLDAWPGTVVSSPECPPTGGCATRVLVKMDNVDDIQEVYPGHHPVLFCGPFARHLKTLATLYELTLRTSA